MAFSVSYIYEILDRYTAPLTRITKATDRFKEKAAWAASSIDKMSGRLQSVGGSLSGFRTAIGGAAIGMGMFKFAQSASTMADAMADVERVTGLTGPGLADMREKLQAMGRATGRSAEGLAAMAYEGGKLGIANEDLTSFVEMVMKTAVAFDMADAEAGRAIGSIRAKLGLSVESVNQLMQRVNFLADSTSASGDKMINIIERTSGTFASLKIPPEVTAGWAAFADQIEVSPERAASGLNMMMSRLMQMPGMMEKMLTDPKNAVINFIKKFESMPEARRGPKILKLFGEEAGKFVLKAVSNTKLLDKAMATAASSKALGSMDREFSNVLRRSSTALKRVKQTLIDVSRAIGTVFLTVWDKYSGRIVKISQSILDFVKMHPGLVKIAGAAGLILTAMAGIAVPLGIVMSMVGAAIPLFTALAAAELGITWPIVAIIAAIAGLVAIWTVVYAKSAMFRQSLANLYDAFTPLIDSIKLLAVTVMPMISSAFGGSGDAIKTWGDIVSVVIDTVAALIRTFFDLVIRFGAAWNKLFSGDILGSLQATPGIGLLMEKIGLGPAKEKAVARQDNKVEMSGRIDVSASGGAKVEKAEIGLDTGYNMAVAQ